jgi:hypothetical protein
MQVQNPNTTLSQLSPGDTAYLITPTAGNGNFVLFVSNYPNPLAGNFAIVYLQTGYLEIRGNDPVYKFPYVAGPA